MRLYSRQGKAQNRLADFWKANRLKGGLYAISVAVDIAAITVSAIDEGGFSRKTTATAVSSAVALSSEQKSVVMMTERSSPTEHDE